MQALNIAFLGIIAVSLEVGILNVFECVCIRFEHSRILAFC